MHNEHAEEISILGNGEVTDCRYSEIAKRILDFTLKKVDGKRATDQTPAISWSVNFEERKKVERKMSKRRPEPTLT